MSALVALFLLAACTGRPLTPSETAFLATIQGDTLDTGRMRLAGDLARGAPVEVPPRPRLTCQERLFPPRVEPALSSPGAMTIFENVHVRPDLWREDFTRTEWQGRAVPDLLDAMLLAHEATHVWQWQNRALTGYFPLKAAFEHVGNPDPYLFDPETRADFLSFGYEQQGAIVEEFVCCRTLAPDAERTQRLFDMISKVMPVARYSDLADEGILLPWSGVEIDGICDQAA
ncbi:MAG: hypothetical protein H3C51_04240 [Rubellimicrobium sp.]|nr:hypothetical protein [Rubellimicrobium sp.]